MHFVTHGHTLTVQQGDPKQSCLFLITAPNPSISFSQLFLFSETLLDHPILLLLLLFSLVQSSHISDMCPLSVMLVDPLEICLNGNEAIVLNQSMRFSFCLSHTHTHTQATLGEEEAETH